MKTRDRRRQITNFVGLGALGLCALIALVPLASILYEVITRGWPALNRDLLFKLPAPVGETGGGMGNAFAGSTILVGMATLIGAPVGLLIAVYLSQYSGSRLSKVLRDLIDLLAGMPSILIGLFAYAVVVKPFGGFSAHAGAVALSLIFIPIAARSAEAALRKVPWHLREAGLALGLSRTTVTFRLIFRAAAPALATSLLLAVARVTGESAPLLFTAFGNPHWSRSLSEPIASVPTQIYLYAISPFEEWHAQAWAAAFVLVSGILVLKVGAQIAFRRKP